MARMETALAGRPMRDYRSFERPDVLPPELVFHGRRIGRHPQGDRGLVRLGDAEHRVLLHRRRRPDEVDPHRQGGEASTAS